MIKADSTEWLNRPTISQIGVDSPSTLVSVGINRTRWQSLRHAASISSRSRSVRFAVSGDDTHTGNSIRGSS